MTNLQQTCCCDESPDIQCGLIGSWQPPDVFEPNTSCAPILMFVPISTKAIARHPIFPFPNGDTLVYYALGMASGHPFGLPFVLCCQLPQGYFGTGFIYPFIQHPDGTNEWSTDFPPLQMTASLVRSTFTFGGVNPFTIPSWKLTLQIVGEDNVGANLDTTAVFYNCCHAFCDQGSPPPMNCPTGHDALDLFLYATSGPLNLAPYFPGCAAEFGFDFASVTGPYPDNCGDPSWACCVDDTCFMMTEDECDDAGGVFKPSQLCNGTICCNDNECENCASAYVVNYPSFQPHAAPPNQACFFNIPNGSMILTRDVNQTGGCAWKGTRKCPNMAMWCGDTVVLQTDIQLRFALAHFGNAWRLEIIVAKLEQDPLGEPFCIGWYIKSVLALGCCADADHYGRTSQSCESMPEAVSIT